MHVVSKSESETVAVGKQSQVQLPVMTALRFFKNLGQTVICARRRYMFWWTYAIFALILREISV